MIGSLVVVGIAVIGLALVVVLVTDGRYFGKGIIRWVYDRLGPSIFGTRSEAAIWHDLADRLPLRSDAILLDVGTARGDLPLTLAARAGFRGYVTGVDWSPRMMAAARSEAQARGVADRAAFQVVDVRDGLPFESAQFDVVCCIGLLETWPHPARILDELVRVLKPEGVLVVSLYKGWSAWSARLSRDWYTHKCAARGLDSVRVIPSRHSQDLLIARRITPPA